MNIVNQFARDLFNRNLAFHSFPRIYDEDRDDYDSAKAKVFRSVLSRAEL